MTWWKLHTEILGQAAMLAASQAALGTWLRVLRYCVTQENGGIIAGAAEWSDRIWLASCNCTAEDIRAASPLIKFEGADAHIIHYQHDDVKAVNGMAEGGKKGKRGPAKAPYPLSEAPYKAPYPPSEAPCKAPYLQIREDKRREEENRQDASADDSAPLLPEIGQKAEKIVAAYAVARGGNRYAAMAAVVNSLETERADPDLMLAAAQRHAARCLALPASEQRFCPGLDTYFATRRWEEPDDRPPWFLGQALSGPVPAEKKIKAPPDERETRRLAAAREIWPDMPAKARWRDLTPEQQDQVLRRLDTLAAVSA